jgi:hypothetical protein
VTVAVSVWALRMSICAGYFCQKSRSPNATPPLGEPT